MIINTPRTVIESATDINSQKVAIFFSKRDGSSFLSIERAIFFPGKVSEDKARIAITKCKNVGTSVDNIINVIANDESSNGETAYSFQLISSINGILEKNANAEEIEISNKIPTTISIDICFHFKCIS